MAPPSDRIVIEFDGDINALKAKLTSSEKQVSKLKKLSAGLGSGLATAGKLAGVAFGGLAAAVTGVVNEAKKFETITTQFEVLTGSAGQARDTVRELQQFAASTPFQFEGISQTAQQLLGFGFQADQLVPKLKAIGDVASAVGQPINDIGLIFGQVAAAGKLTGERLLQFQERAVPIGAAIAKTLGVAEESVKKLVSEGAVDFATFEKAFQSLSKEGGFAFEGMIKQSQTLGGLVSTVRDNISLFAASMGERLLPVAKVLATQMLEFLQNLNKTGEGLDTFSSVMQGMVNIGLRVKNVFDNLGTVIGVGLATAIEAASAAISLNFSKATEIAKIGAQGLREEITKNNKEMNQELADIDAAFQEAKKSGMESEKQAIIKHEQEKTEIKAQAKVDENELLKEIEEQLNQENFESEMARQERINELTKQNLQKNFDAKRAVNQEDIKASNKENQLRMKEEVRYGKELAAARSFFRSKEVEGTKMMLDNLVTLGQSGNRQLMAIAKAAAIARAIMNTAEGVTKALTFGPILGPALAATIAAAGAVQIGVISSQGFARGGLVEGGRPGVDSVPALMQRGEVVAPRQNFEEVIGSVRARREAEKMQEESLGGGAMEVVIGFKDDAFEIIEERILERRQLGIGAI